VAINNKKKKTLISALPNTPKSPLISSCCVPFVWKKERPDIYLFRVGTKSIEINDLTQFFLFSFSRIETLPRLVFYREGLRGKAGQPTSKGKKK
jgi:hypothetical protein